MTKKENLPLSIRHYLSHMPMLAAQWTGQNYHESSRQRLYLKDIDCPPLWHDKLKEQIPPGVFYLNDSVGDIGGIGAKEERYANGVGSRLGKGIGKAGDLMSCLPISMRAENLMCYIGHEGTYTPAHREMCASLGQNIMVETSGAIGEDGKPTKPGSSIWFMTETKDRHLVSEYWLSNLGHDIEVEDHFASIDAWVKAPFKVWAVEQKVGDFILIPPLAPHQVWNRGTRTMKVAWNRTTVETLEMALKEALPRARMVCRDEQYKNKAIILFSLNKYSGLLRTVERQRLDAQSDHARSQLTSSPKIRQLEKDFRRLYALFVDMMVSETLSPPHPKIEYIQYDSNITCSYCRCNIFNRFLTCKHCIIPLENGEEDTYDICMECYAMGRSCRCLSKLSWVEQFPFRDLVQKYDLWRNQVSKFPDSLSRNCPLPLDQEKQQYGKKTLADVCQEQLKIRPFKDPKKDEVPEDDKDEEDEEDVEVTADGTIRKKKVKRSEKWYKDNLRCHLCCHRHPKWKMTTCSCGVSICYGSLWRAFDTMPQTVMQDPDWRCPKCRKICPCKDCTKDPENHPYEPKGTVLGHDTRKFADPRSIESLVDFSASNMHWIKKAGDDVTEESRRMSRHADAAAQERARDPALGVDYVRANNHSNNMAIDPLLAPDQVTEDGEDEQVGIQQAAADALNMMGGLSALERDPQAFMAQAGLRRNSSQEQSYEYPDPDEAPSILPTTENDESGQAEKKKKKARDAPIVQSDAALSEANAKFQKQQAQVRIKEAKRKGHLISTQAAIRGRSLVVTLPVDPATLARFTQERPPEPMDIEPEADEQPVIVQSDLPKNVSGEVATSRNPQVPKKRPRTDEDGDFVMSKRERRSSGKVIWGKTSASNIQEQAPRSDSEIDVEADPEEDFTFTPTRRQSNGIAGSRRSLPSYLARRSPVATDELPNELTGKNRERRKPKPTAASNGTAQHFALDLSPTEASPPSRKSPKVTNAAEVSTDTEELVSLRDDRSPVKAPTARMTPPLIAISSSPTPFHASGEPPAQPQASKTAMSDGGGEASELDSELDSEVDSLHKAKPKPSPGRIAANVKAKLIASGQVMVESESDFDSGSVVGAPEVISDIPAPAPAPAKRGRGRPPKASRISPEVSKSTAAKGPSPERKSIFSKTSRGGKIKIASARALAKS